MATTANELLDAILPFLNQPLSLEQLYSYLGEMPKEDKCEIDPV